MDSFYLHISLSDTSTDRRTDGNFKPPPTFFNYFLLSRSRIQLPLLTFGSRRTGKNIKEKTISGSKVCRIPHFQINAQSDRQTKAGKRSDYRRPTTTIYAVSTYVPRTRKEDKVASAVAASVGEKKKRDKGGVL
jgi:hypothetical protein